MPTFKFRGFTSASRVALSVAQGAQTASADTTWGLAQANASFTIELLDSNTDNFAPYAAVFRATGLTGFSVAEPSAPLAGAGSNVYDPTQHRVTFVWDFEDAGYAPAFAPNIPTAWRNLNLAYGKQVAHVWHTPGSYTVTCFAFDNAGNWGTATYTFGAGGQRPAIADPNAAFPGANTIVLSQAGNFTDAPAGATQCSTLAAAHAALRTLVSAGGNNRNYRVLVRAGETWTDSLFFNVGSDGGFPGGPNGGYRNGIKGFFMGTFGAGARPTVNIRPRNEFGTPFGFPDRADCRQYVVSGFDFRGDWDAGKETGWAGSVMDLITTEGLVLLTRCRFDGFSDAPGDRLRETRYTFLHDTEITNWANYGLYADNSKLAVVGCDIHQKADALSGINQGAASQVPWSFGNRHGCFRSGSRSQGGATSVWSCTAFFSRNGWSNNNGNWNTQPPTADQSCTRFHNHFNENGNNGGRHHHVFERCSFEGGWAPVVGLGPTGMSNGGAAVEINAKNLLIDKCLIVGGGATSGSLLASNLSGVTIRNSYFYRHAVTSGAAGEASAEIEFTRFSNGDPSGSGPIEIYNNTFLNNRTAGFASGYAPIKVPGGAPQTIENNVVRIVNRAGFEGASFLPLGTSALAGFSCRYIGTRWNFPPLSSSLRVDENTWTATSRREQPGNPGILQPGDVANFEWVVLPYPDWTGRCNGAGFPVTRSRVVANSTQKHRVSLSGVSTKAMGDVDLWSLADGRVKFDFIESGIRIQNRTGAAWTVDSGSIAVLLDMSDSLMAPVAATASPPGIPLAAPQPGSAAIVQNGAGLWARDDFFGLLRNGQTIMGAFLPAA